MKIKAVISVLLLLLLTLGIVLPALAAPARQTAKTAQTGSGAQDFVSFFQELFAKIKSLFTRMKYRLEVKKERVPNTMNKNVIHMLRSVENTICDSFIITTEDGKVIVIDGGSSFETDYFIQYLKAVTGQRKPHIDAWFLSHPHNDHVEVFRETVAHYADQVSFDQVMLH